MKKISAFTFIEVVIAITVFAIGVLAVLRLITQNLVTLDNTQMRTTATFLAKEWMELVYNMRDSNLDKLLPRDCVLDENLSPDDFGDIQEQDVCVRNFASGTEDDTIFQISFASGTYMHALPVEKGEDFASLRNENRLYLTTWDIASIELFRYAHQEIIWGETPFARYIVFDVVHEWEKILPPNKILKVESHVLYMKGTKTGEVVLESFIWNY